MQIAFFPDIIFLAQLLNEWFTEMADISVYTLKKDEYHVRTKMKSLSVTAMERNNVSTMLFWLVEVCVIEWVTLSIITKYLKWYLIASVVT